MPSEGSELLDLAGVTAYRHDLSRAFGDMAEDAYRDLVANIRDHGLLDPSIVAVDGKDGIGIVDGWHRARAAVELGIADSLTPQVLPETDDRAALVKLVAKLNLHRRHLTPGQRADAVTRMTEYFRDGKIAWSMSVREQAEVAGTSTKTVQSARAKAAKAAGAEPAGKGGRPRVSKTTNPEPGLPGVADGEEKVDATRAREGDGDDSETAVERHEAAVESVVESSQGQASDDDPDDEDGPAEPAPPTALEKCQAENESLKDTLAAMKGAPTRAEQARLDALATMRSQRDEYQRRLDAAIAELKVWRRKEKRR